ncbi:Serine/threonine protein kinase (fragment) [Hyella patelloides LEGE 07179]|uniref:Serine/threonine protein kinase n=1 Tax=Hyella patelloides LEGE 07179 TaxID=945734 RepID=A0A563W1E9_9CYAN
MSYENAAQDVARYTGMIVSGKTQQRLVHRYQFRDAECKSKVGEISVDGGKIRLRTETKGEACIWRDYKAICINSQSRMGWFQENKQLVEWVNHQPFDTVLNCLGDGHPGIGSSDSQFHPQGETRQILDWFHLAENLYKVGGSLKRIAQGKQLLWQGKVDATLALFSPMKKKAAQNFCTYLQNHRHRIVNYDYYQAENICSIASGAVESTA